MKKKLMYLAVLGILIFAALAWIFMSGKSPQEKQPDNPTASSETKSPESDQVAVKDRVKTETEQTKTEIPPKTKAVQNEDVKKETGNAASPVRQPYPEPEVKWTVKTKSFVQGTPTIGLNGDIYIGSGDGDGQLYALFSDGTIRWRFQTQEKYGKSNLFAPPAIGEDGTIYLAGGSDNCIYALTPLGKLKWQFTAEGDGRVDCSPALAEDGTIYFIANKEAKIKKFAMYAITPNGKKKWSLKLPQSTDACPAIAADGTIYIHLWNGDIRAISPEGEVVWIYESRWGSWSSPAIADDGTIYCGIGGKKLVALTPEGQEKWTFELAGASSASPAIGADGTVYMPAQTGKHTGTLYAINPDGSLKWKVGGPGGISSPAIDANGVIYLGGPLKSRAYVYAINPDGTILWRYHGSGSFFSSPIIGPDGTIYIGTCGNDIVAITGTSGPATAQWPTFSGGIYRRGRVQRKTK